MKQIIPTAEPFFFQGSRTGILLVHGFTGTPKEMRWLGEFLHRQYNFTVLCIRLSGHATKAEDMIRSSYTDWIASIEDGYALLSTSVDSIFVMGLSMGGILSLTTAAYLPFSGVVAMSTPYKLPNDPRLKYVKLLSKLIPYMPKTNHQPGVDWFDKEGFKNHISYKKNPLHAIGELNKLLEQMRSGLPLITMPVLLIHSKNDDYVLKESMPNIYANLTTTQKQMVWIEGSNHVITSDAQRQLVGQTAADFVLKLAV
ncbi:MAG: alpha/beta fold hydrolase [Chloroflexota bacterium]